MTKRIRDCGENKVQMQWRKQMVCDKRLLFASVFNLFFFFFFSSRRRHTRYIGDWSSDVCSSDLLRLETAEEIFYGSRPADEDLQGIAKRCSVEHEEKARPPLSGGKPQRHLDAGRSEERRVGKEGRRRGVDEEGRKKERKKEKSTS